MNQDRLDASGAPREVGQMKVTPEIGAEVLNRMLGYASNPGRMFLVTPRDIKEIKHYPASEVVAVTLPRINEGSSTAVHDLNVRGYFRQQVQLMFGGKWYYVYMIPQREFMDGVDTKETADESKVDKTVGIVREGIAGAGA